MHLVRPLPWCAGPKLAPFCFKAGVKEHVAILEHIRSGLHGEVFRANIQGDEFALKVFRFFRARELIPEDTRENGLATVEDVLNQNDPFNCECRAYGRLKEVGREDLAVQWYLMLDKVAETGLTNRGFDDWSRCDVFKGPLRCIVKELLPQCISAVSYPLLPQMLKDLQDLHAYGVVVWDLRSGNYLDGKKIDFSQAKTVLHIELSWNSNPLSRKWAIDSCARHYAGFDGVISDWNDGHPEQPFWHRFLPNSKFGRRLRDRSRFKKELARCEGVRLDVIFYDWKKKQPWKAKVGNFPEMSEQGEGEDNIEKSYARITAIKTRATGVRRTRGSNRRRRPQKVKNG